MGHPEWLTAEKDDDKDPFGMKAHDDNCEHSGIGGHYCLEFDGLWICQDCTEFAVCNCLSPYDRVTGKRLEPKEKTP